jgi:SAM-dependent methyltransferase
MMFRTPTDDPSSNQHFYDNEYSQGFTTDVPSVEALARLKRSNFAGTEKDYSDYIRVLTALGLKPSAKIFDFGCSWGYGSHQLATSGFDVTSFEVASNRSRYARDNLDVRTVDDMDRAAADLCASFDCFFSAHVLEHVPSPAKTFDYAMRLLNRNGLFVSFTPNGSESFRTVSPAWSQLWGEVHPNFIDDVFLDYSFKLSPRCIGSSPATNAALPDRPEAKRLDGIDRPELFFSARKIGDAWG